MKSGVHFFSIHIISLNVSEFLLNLYPGEKNTREKLSTSIDNLNMRYGKRIINFGVHREHPGFFERE